MKWTRDRDPDAVGTVALVHGFRRSARQPSAKMRSPTWADPANMEFGLNGADRREYVVRDHSYHLVFHTFIHKGETLEFALIAQQSTQLQFLRRKFLEDLASGEKIFVMKRNATLTESEALALHAALRRHEDNTLLYVVQATTDHPPGTVVQVRPACCAAISTDLRRQRMRMIYHWKFGCRSCKRHATYP